MACCGRVSCPPREDASQTLGPFRLTRSLDSARGQLFAAVGEGVDATRCHGAADCQDGLTCLTHDLWSELSQEIDVFLKGVTLATLVDQRTVQEVASRQDDRLFAERESRQVADAQRIAARHLS